MFEEGSEHILGMPIQVQYRISKASNEYFDVKLYLNNVACAGNYSFKIKVTDQRNFIEKTTEEKMNAVTGGASIPGLF